MSSNTRMQLEEWLGKIDVPALSRVVDIGGAQNPIKGRTNTWGASLYKILDLENPHEQKRSPDIIGDIEHYLFDQFVENCDECGEYIGRLLFDIAFCIEVSEYWYRPETALRNIAKNIKQGGILYISFHFIYPHHNPVGKDYLRYTRWGAKKLLEEAGFQIEEIVDRVTESSSFRAFFRGEGMRPAVADDINHEAIGWLIKCSKK